MTKQTFLQKFIAFNEQKKLASAKKRTLIAVSGGLDSSVLCELFHQAQFPFAIAHCNFSLRGTESDEDENFVQSLAIKYGVEIFVKKFDTKSFAEHNKLSIQVAARQLRYEWFREVKIAHKFNFIATAHHASDSLETTLYNLTKGTGIKGLRGIQAKVKDIIRPLLFADRSALETFHHKENVTYRIDSSNAEDKYARNKIRHHVIPVLKEINPALEATWSKKMELFDELERLYEAKIKKLSKQLFLPRRNDIYIPIAKLLHEPHAASLLYEYLSEFDFNAAQNEDMLQALDSESGKQFLSSKARVIKDRAFFILTTLPEKEFTIQLIQSNESEVLLGTNKITLSSVHTTLPEITKLKNTKVAFVDADELTFPLVIRRWKDGDYFYPNGMNRKKKKLKKFFGDIKMPVHEKENVWILESDGRIVWVVGHRLDERFCITSKTKSCIELKYT